MNDIKLSVSDENLETLLTVLNNLKDGLVTKIEINGTQKTKSTQYKPKINTIIREENSATNDTSGKYGSASTYRDRLKKNNKKI